MGVTLQVAASDGAFDLKSYFADVTQFYADHSGDRTAYYGNDDIGIADASIQVSQNADESWSDNVYLGPLEALSSGHYGISVDALLSGTKDSGKSIGEVIYDQATHKGTTGNALWRAAFDGDDILTGHAGTDNLSGGDGNDIINGGDGNDVLSGGNGDDTLSAGYGTTEMSGGRGTDTFLFDKTYLPFDEDHGRNELSAKIEDFVHGQDIISFVGSNITDFSELAISYQKGRGASILFNDGGKELELELHIGRGHNLDQSDFLFDTPSETQGGHDEFFANGAFSNFHMIANSAID